MNFNFGEVLTKAWQIIWKHKVLWIFGILASCGQGGGGGNGGGNSRSWQGNGSDFGRSNLPPQFMRWFQNIEDNIKTYIAIGIALICVIWIIVIFISTIGRIGLIRGTFQADGEVEKLIFGQLFSESTPYFWRMFGLSLILALPILILVGTLFAGIIVFAMSTSNGNSAALRVVAMVPILIGCLCLLMPVMFVAGMIIRQAQNAIVLEDMSVMPALSRGWEIFRANLGPIIVMAIILAILGFAIGLLIAIPVLSIVVPAAFTFILGDAQKSWTPIIIAGVLLCLYIPVALVLKGIATSYIEAAWTLTYMRLTKPQDDAPLALETNA